jgi:hypothetical protein
MLNAKGTSLFTEYKVVVEHWIYPRRDASASIEVIKGGGEVVIGAELTIMEEGERLRLGMPYLMFLKSVPDTSARELVGAPITSSPGWANQLVARVLPVELANESVAFEQFRVDLQQAGEAC